jgi:hypothetical protein
MRRSHSISFTGAQGIPKYKIGFGREKDARVGEILVTGPFHELHKSTGYPEVQDGVWEGGGMGELGKDWWSIGTPSKGAMSTPAPEYDT